MPVLLVRHAAAGSRRAWSGDDLARPLDDRGRRQSAGLVAALADFAVGRALSSPAVRCIATVQPLADDRGLTVEAHDDLFEGHGGQALALARAFLTPGSDVAGPDGSAVVVCSHGDVIPDILAVLEADGAELGDDRRCQKGSTWVLWRPPDGDVAGRYLAPPS